MKKYQLYIAHFLLAGFLFPQVVNAVHYMVQTHSFSATGDETYNIAIPSYDYHNCHYQFNSLKYNITTGENFKLFILGPLERKEKYFYGIKFVNDLPFHYTLRGPPPIVDYKEDQNLFIKTKKLLK